MVKGFEVFVENGQQVKKGDAAVKLDIAYLKEHAPSIVSPVLCTELEVTKRYSLLRREK